MSCGRSVRYTFPGLKFNFMVAEFELSCSFEDGEFSYYNLTISSQVTGYGWFRGYGATPDLQGTYYDYTYANSFGMSPSSA